MVQEEKVTKRVAELLRLKQFDESCWWAWMLYTDDTSNVMNYTLERWFEYPHRNSEYPDGNMAILPAPTVQVAIDWLETKGYWITYRPLNYNCGVDTYIYTANDDGEWYAVKNFVTSTKYKGLNMALEYCLENLI